MNPRFLNIAKKVSKEATYKGSRTNVNIGAVLVYHGTILAKGSNSNKTHPMQDKMNALRYDKENLTKYCPPKIHAEIACLTKCRWLDIDFSKVELYIYREYQDGTTALARPCKACAQAIREMGIKKVCYSTENGYCEERYGD